MVYLSNKTNEVTEFSELIIRNLGFLCYCHLVERNESQTANAVGRSGSGESLCSHSWWAWLPSFLHLSSHLRRLGCDRYSFLCRGWCIYHSGQMLVALGNLGMRGSLRTMSHAVDLFSGFQKLTLCWQQPLSRLCLRLEFLSCSLRSM